MWLEGKKGVGVFVIMMIHVEVNSLCQTWNAGSVFCGKSLKPADEVGKSCHPPLIKLLRRMLSGRIAKQPQKKI